MTCRGPNQASQCSQIHHIFFQFFAPRRFQHFRNFAEPRLVHDETKCGQADFASTDMRVSIDAIWRVIPKVKTKIALETTAGQGSCLGHHFEHIAHIIKNVHEPERICVCLDTAHIFAAGYDIGSENAAKKTFRKFDRIIPQARDRLVAIHLNDSKAARGSRVDRHAHIGKGKIGLAAFRFIMNEPRFGKIPKVLETPKGKELKEDVVNLKTLRRLIASPTPSSRAQARAHPSYSA